MTKRLIENISIWSPPCAGKSATSGTGFSLFQVPKAIAIVGLIAFTLGGARGQSSSAFEVASVKLNKTAGGRASAEFSAGGERFSATNMSLGMLIVTAYGITVHQVAPNDSALYEKYDIQAKADHAIGREQMLRMIQALLADRFQTTRPRGR